MSDLTSIFVSYSRKDADFALQLAADLRNAGVQVWMDQLDGIRIGDDWRRAIQAAVDGCAALIAVLTPDYVCSTCLNELARAEERAVPIFPVLFRAVAGDRMPIELQRIQRVDFSDSEGQARYRQRIDELVEQITARATRQIGERPDPEIRYLTTMIADLERQIGVTRFVEPAVHLLNEARDVRPRPSIVTDWGLEDAFLVAEEPRPTARARPGEPPQAPPVSLRDTIEGHSRFVLTGAPGAGKTTAVKRLALEAARDRLQRASTAPIPLLLQLAKWSDDSSPADFIGRQCPVHPDPISALSRGDATLYLDGLNEMGGDCRQRAARLAQWLGEPGGPRRVVVTCRDADYGDLELPLPRVSLEPLDHARIVRFVSNYLTDDGPRFLEKLGPLEADDRESSRTLLRLARNPFLLTALLVSFSASPEKELPRNNGQLFRQLVRTLWERERARRTAGWVPVSELESACGRLAFAIIDRGLPVEVPLDFAVSWIGSEERLHAASRASLLVTLESGVRFYHQLVLEYFAAIELERIGVGSRVTGLEYIWGRRRSQKWDQVVIAAVGIAPDPEAVLRTILAKDPYLAALCVLSGCEVGADLRNEIGGGLVEYMLASRAQAAAINEEFAASRMHEDEWLEGGYGHTVMRVLDEVPREIGSMLRNVNAAGAPAMLMERLEQDRVAVQEALRALGADAVPELVRTLRQEGVGSSIRGTAAFLLGELNDSAAVPVLLQTLDADVESVRRAVLTALTRIGDETAVPALLDALLRSDQPADVRRLAADALRHIGSATAVAALSEALRHDEVSVLAKQALTGIGTPEAVEAMKRG